MSEPKFTGNLRQIFKDEAKISSRFPWKTQNNPNADFHMIPYRQIELKSEVCYYNTH